MYVVWDDGGWTLVSVSHYAWRPGWGWNTGPFVIIAAAVLCVVLLRQRQNAGTSSTSARCPGCHFLHYWLLFHTIHTSSVTGYCQDPFFFFYICGLCFKVVDRGQMCWMRERRHLTGSVVIWTYNTHGDSCYCFEVRTWDSGMLSAHTQLTRNNDWHKLICLLYRRYRNVW